MGDTACKLGPHLLLLPYVEHGHITPMLSLASQLAALTALHCKVTFVNPASLISAASLMEASPTKINAGHVQDVVVHSDECMGDRLQFVTVTGNNSTSSASNHSCMSSQHNILLFMRKLAALEAQKDLIEKLVLDSKASPHPISWIICDCVLWKWVQKIADKHALQLAILVVSTGIGYLPFYLWQVGKGAELEELLVSTFNLPGKDDARRRGLFSGRDSPELQMQKLQFLATLVEGLEHVARPHFLVNSFKQLEEPLLPLVEAVGAKITYIAPAFANGGGGDVDVSMGNRRVLQAGSARVAEEECMAWLDRQERGSVLFVSFGSEGMLDPAHVEEISTGIYNSGYCFLWVIRSDTPGPSRPTEAFCRCCGEQGRGIFVAWAPQKAVLRHAAVGGFLTHSGWNSTMESLSCGVPMLCLPFMGDHPIIANLVQSYWQVGLCLQYADGVISRDDVDRGVRAIMQGAFSRRVLEWKLAAQQAGKEIHQNLTSLFQQY